MRATIHNGRAGKDGAYNPEHNSRNFNLSHAEHIDPEQSKKNWYWNCFNKAGMNFDDVEAEFYKIHCTEHLKAQNARYTAQRHPERVKTMDEYRRNPRTCPEETILMIGRLGDSMPPNTLRGICEEFRDWEEKTFPGLHVVDMALHMDEQGAPHIHERKVWLYADEQGNEAVGQNKSLEQAGIQLPNPEKPRNRYNNRKQVYSEQARQKFIDICKEKGFESLLETQPRERSKSGLTQLEYKAQRAEERAATAEMRARVAEQKALQTEQERNAARTERERIRGALTHARARAEKAQKRAEEQQAENSRLKTVESQIRGDMERQQRIARQLADENTN